MAAWRYDIYLLVLKNISVVRCAHQVKYFSTLEDICRVSARPCNIPYIPMKQRLYFKCIFFFEKQTKRKARSLWADLNEVYPGFKKTIATAKISTAFSLILSNV